MNEHSSRPLSLETAQSLIRDGSFEEALRALEAVVEYLERGRLPLDEAVAWYEAGLELSRRCADLLQAADLRISMLDDAYAVPSQVPAAMHNDDG